MKLGALLLGSLLFLAACASTSAAQSPPTPTPKPAQPALEKPTYTVQRGTILDQLKLSGHVAAVQQQDLVFTQDGHLKTLYVDRTSVITAGQLLAELDLGELPNQLRQAQVAYEQAQLALEQARAQQAFAVRRAQLDLESARARLQELQAPDPAEVAQARAAVQQAQAALDQTRSNASAAKTKAELALKQAASELVLVQAEYAKAAQNWERVKDHPNDPQWEYFQDQYLKAEAALHNAEAAMDQAQVEYDTARQNEGPAVRQAEATLAEAQARLDALLKPDPNELAEARRAVDRAALALEEAQQSGIDPELEKRVATAQLDVERIQAQIDAGRLYAPFDGRVAQISARPGDAIAAYKPVISVMNEAQLELLVENVSTQDATRIGVGQPVEITFSRYSGKTFTGTVTRLPTNLTSSSSSVDSDPAYHIEFEAPGVELDVGDLAQVTITLARKDNALWLPPQAVRAFEGRRFVVVKDGDRQRRQDVRVGIVAPDRVEILEGLNEGDVVIGQ